MSDNPNASKPVTEIEFATIRQSVQLLRSQIRAGRTDPAFMTRQLEKLDSFLDRIAQERQKSQGAGQFEALYNVSRALGASLDVQTVLDQVMDAIIQLTGAERGFLMIQDDDGQLKVNAARNLDQQTLSSDDFGYSRTVANRVLDSGEPILTTNAAEDPRFAGQASIVAQALRSIMATALRARGQVIGVAYVDSRAMNGLFSDDNLNALDALSGQAAIAIDNALLFNATDQQLAQRVEELRQLRRIDLLLSESLDSSQAMQVTLEWACRLGKASSGHLGLVEGEVEADVIPHIPALHHYGEDVLDHDTALEVAHPQAVEVVRTGQARTLTTDHNGTQHHTLIVPIRREQKVFGIVVLDRPGDAFNGEQQDLVERVVARAAIAIENARLYAAVRAADLAKTEFVGIVAHDLKAPMNGIGGYADLMVMQGDLTDRQTDYLKKIKGTVDRMAMLVSDLADISRIESGLFFMEETSCTVEEVVQAVKDGTMPQIEERKHTLVEDMPADLPIVHTDYYRLVQVLTNLVTNAYKYTPDGGSITLSARLDGDRVAFTVADTGIGLTPDGIAKLQTGAKFWRAEDRFTRSQPGTGLGFAITRGLIEQMGSTIVIESEVGKGSRFSFSVATVQRAIADEAAD